ncbi:MAG TPA: heme-binding domain-containing protein, partial [Bacteroidia bacterium]|nr:heme-binding domain-containing protein [Bacteroidia bacterium]
AYEPKKMDHKLEELIESQEEGWMPISSYTFIHKDAILNAEQKKAIIDYAKEVKAAVGYVPTAEDLAKEKERQKEKE